jgi:hypothetical protein
MTLGDEVDQHDARRAVGDTGAGEDHVDRVLEGVDGPIDAGPVAQIHLDRCIHREVDVGHIHDGYRRPELVRKLRHRGAHAGRAADHQNVPASVTERLGAHVLQLPAARMTKQQDCITYADDSRRRRL